MLHVVQLRLHVLCSNRMFFHYSFLLLFCVYTIFLVFFIFFVWCFSPSLCWCYWWIWYELNVLRCALFHFAANIVCGLIRFFVVVLVGVCPKPVRFGLMNWSLKIVLNGASFNVGFFFVITHCDRIAFEVKKELEINALFKSIVSNNESNGISVAPGRRSPTLAIVNGCFGVCSMQLSRFSNELSHTFTHTWPTVNEQMKWKSFLAVRSHPLNAELVDRCACECMSNCHRSFMPNSHP